MNRLVGEIGIASIQSSRSSGPDHQKGAIRGKQGKANGTEVSDPPSHAEDLPVKPGIGDWLGQQRHAMFSVKAEAAIDAGLLPALL